MRFPAFSDVLDSCPRAFQLPGYIGPLRPFSSLWAPTLRDGPERLTDEAKAEDEDQTMGSTRTATRQGGFASAFIDALHSKTTIDPSGRQKGGWASRGLCEWGRRGSRALMVHAHGRRVGLGGTLEIRGRFPRHFLRENGRELLRTG